MAVGGAVGGWGGRRRRGRKPGRKEWVRIGQDRAGLKKNWRLCAVSTQRQIIESNADTENQVTSVNYIVTSILRSLFPF